MLDPIEVSVRPTLRGRRLLAAHERMELYSGFFMAEVDFERRGTPPLGLLMGGIPGTEVTGGTSPSDPYLLEARGGLCQPTVWVNRRLARMSDPGRLDRVGSPLAAGRGSPRREARCT